MTEWHTRRIAYTSLLIWLFAHIHTHTRNRTMHGMCFELHNNNNETAKWKEKKKQHCKRSKKWELDTNTCIWRPAYSSFATDFSSHSFYFFSFSFSQAIHAIEQKKERKNWPKKNSKTHKQQNIPKKTKNDTGFFVVTATTVAAAAVARMCAKYRYNITNIFSSLTAIKTAK